MAKFLNTSATNYYLEELIKNASDRLILISPFLKLNDRIKELLEDKNRLKIDVRIVYGKSELQPMEINWLNELSFIRTSFCKNLHAKCYMNESDCIITSLNLYEFSQVNNNEMGVHVSRVDDAEMYRDTYDEAQRIIRISDEVRISLQNIDNSTSTVEKTKKQSSDNDSGSSKITSSKLAIKLQIKTSDLLEKLVLSGHIEEENDKITSIFFGKKRDKGSSNQLQKLKKKLYGTFTYVVNLGGYVNHSFSRNIEKKMKKRVPLKRFGKHIELANLASYLISDQAGYINGEVVTIDGGEWLKGAGQFNELDKLPKALWKTMQRLRKHSKK